VAREMWVCLERVPTLSGGLDTVLRGVFSKKVRAQNASDGQYTLIIPARVNQVLTDDEYLELINGNLRV